MSATPACDGGVAAAAVVARSAAAAPLFLLAGVLSASASFCLSPEWKLGSELYSTGRGLLCLCQNLPKKSRSMKL
jgi:hypothetical protein